MKFGNQICIPMIKWRCLDCSKRFELLNSRAGRAGVVHNFMRGVSLQQTFPLSPFTPEDSGVNRVSGKISSTKIYSYLPAFIVDLGFITFLFLDITITMKKCNHPVFISDKPVLFFRWLWWFVGVASHQHQTSVHGGCGPDLQLALPPRPPPPEGSGNHSVLWFQRAPQWHNAAVQGSTTPAIILKTGSRS